MRFEKHPLRSFLVSTVIDLQYVCFLIDEVEIALIANNLAGSDNTQAVRELLTRAEHCDRFMNEFVSERFRDLIGAVYSMGVDVKSGYTMLD